MLDEKCMVWFECGKIMILTADGRKATLQLEKGEIEGIRKAIEEWQNGQQEDNAS